MSIEIEKRYADEREVSKITGRAIQTIRNDRARGCGIPYSKNGRSVRYFLPDVYEHMRDRRVVPGMISG